MKHIIDSKINNKIVQHAKMRSAAKVKIQELILILQKQLDAEYFEVCDLMLETSQLVQAMMQANTCSMQIDVYEDLRTYED